MLYSLRSLVKSRGRTKGFLEPKISGTTGQIKMKIIHTFLLSPRRSLRNEFHKIESGSWSWLPLKHVIRYCIRLDVFFCCCIKNVLWLYFKYLLKLFLKQNNTCYSGKQRQYPKLPMEGLQLYLLNEINKFTFDWNVRKEQKHRSKRPLRILAESGHTDK